MTMSHLACLATALLLGSATLGHAAPREGLPQRNLLVSWRISGEGHSMQRQGGMEVGRVIIDSRRGVVGHVGLNAGTLSTDTQGQAEQQVLVLNGGRARIFVGRTQSVTAWQLVGNPYAPQSGQAGQSTLANPAVTAVPQTLWVDVGQGIHVTPRWTGGRDVVVELEAQSRQPTQPGSTYSSPLDPDGQTRHSEYASTVSVPLGEWMVVARQGNSVQRSLAGTLSTRDVDERLSEQLEIRVTLP